MTFPPQELCHGLASPYSFFTPVRRTAALVQPFGVEVAGDEISDDLRTFAVIDGDFFVQVVQAIGRVIRAGAHLQHRQPGLHVPRHTLQRPGQFFKVEGFGQVIEVGQLQHTKRIVGQRAQHIESQRIASSLAQGEAAGGQVLADLDHLPETFNLEELIRPLERVSRHMPLAQLLRSEERRVGKECRSRWSPYH